MEVSGQLHAPATLVPLDRRLGGPRNRSGHCGVEKVHAITESGTPAVQPVARPYID
jgi:hypothetical protein